MNNVFTFDDCSYVMGKFGLVKIDKPKEEVEEVKEVGFFDKPFLLESLCCFLVLVLLAGLEMESSRARAERSQTRIHRVKSEK